MLANLDGLNDYDEDFRSAGAIAEAVRSAYRAGKGYVRAEQQPPVSDSPAEPDALEASDDGAAEQAGADEDVEADGAPATVAAGNRNCRFKRRRARRKNIMKP